MEPYYMDYRHDGFPEEQAHYTLCPDLEAEAGHYGRAYKVALIGNSNVGKTSLVDRYINHEFHENMGSTMGVDFGIKCLRSEFSHGKRRLIETLQLWDTAGMERFRAITQSYYRSMNAIIVMYDVTDADSFNSLPLWIEDIVRCCGDSDPLLFIVGNKTDLTGCRMVDTRTAMAFALQYGIPFTEMSVKADHNVDDALATVLEHVRNRVAMHGVMSREEHTIRILDEEAQITAQQEQPIYGRCWC